METLETLPSSSEPKILKDTPLKTKMEPENGPLKRRFIIFKGDLRAYISQTTYTPKTNMFPKKGPRDCLPTSIFQGTLVHFRGGGATSKPLFTCSFFNWKVRAFFMFWSTSFTNLVVAWEEIGWMDHQTFQVPIEWRNPHLRKLYGSGLYVRGSPPQKK